MGLETKAAVADETSSAKLAKRMPQPPPPPPPAPRRSWSSSSVTRREIEKFWRKKRLVEEEHFLAAIKAAARLRASRLSEKDYLLFLEENKIEQDGVSRNRTNHTENKGTAPTVHQEIRVGIKDWWTKSQYAYLNQPAVGSTGRRDRRSNYIPNNFYFCNYKYSPAAAATVSSQAQAQAQAQSQAPPPPCLGVF